MDAKTEELRAAHDVLAEFYACRLADALDRMPAERAVLGLFCESVIAAGLGTSVGDIGCGTGRKAPRRDICSRRSPEPPVRSIAAWALGGLLPGLRRGAGQPMS